jgi:hypothetical protein
MSMVSGSGPESLPGTLARGDDGAAESNVTAGNVGVLIDKLPCANALKAEVKTKNMISMRAVIIIFFIVFCLE